jgi:uncharacterized protein
MLRQPPSLRNSLLLTFALLGCIGPRLAAGDVPFPAPTRLVVDMAAVLDADDETRLESRLQDLRASGRAEMIIYLAPSLPEGAVMEDLTITAVNTWGIGDSATNNGLAVFAFMKDRKVRIEVGLGLEDRISDDAAAAIIAD